MERGPFVLCCLGPLLQACYCQVSAYGSLVAGAGAGIDDGGPCIDVYALAYGGSRRRTPLQQQFRSHVLLLQCNGQVKAAIHKAINSEFSSARGSTYHPSPPDSSRNRPLRSYNADCTCGWANCSGSMRWRTMERSRLATPTDGETVGGRE
jgi:hypothetical protein